MAGTTTRTLKLKFDGDSTGLAQASKTAGATVEKFNRTTEKTASRIGAVNEKSDALASKSSVATGALGALGSGFTLAFGEGNKYTAALEKAALASDFMSGVGDSLALVTEAVKGKMGLAKKATDGMTKATKGQTVAQRILNTVMRANPLGIIVTVLAAVAAALVVAYKKSDTFRAICDKAFRAVAEVGRWMWNTILQPVFRFLLLGIATVADGWAKLLRGMSKVPGFGWARGAADLMGTAAGKARAIADNMDKIPKDTKVRVRTQGLSQAATAAERLARALANAVVSAGSNVLNDLGFNVTGRAGNNAQGTRHWRGGPTWVGESGPELLNLPRGASITPNQAAMAGGLEVRVFLGDREIRDLVRTEVTETNRRTIRRARAGVAAA